MLGINSGIRTVYQDQNSIRDKFRDQSIRDKFRIRINSGFRTVLGINSGFRTVLGINSGFRKY